MREIIEVDGLPKAGPYSLAVRYENIVFLSGQTGDGSVFAEQFKNAMNKVSKILSEAGSGLENVLKVTVYLANSSNFSEMNSLYGEYFKSNFPARTTVIVSFPNNKIMVEIDVIAYIKRK